MSASVDMHPETNKSLGVRAFTYHGNMPGHALTIDAGSERVTIHSLTRKQILKLSQDIKIAADQLKEPNDETVYANEPPPF